MSRNFVLIASIAASSVVYFFLFINFSLGGKVNNQDQVVEASISPALADGCYHVYLDVGGNIGNHVRFLFEPNLYPHARTARSFFTKIFGPESERVNTDICVFSFEPNPDHYARHDHLSKAYSNFNWRFTPIHAGVGHQTGNITFYHVGDDLGFTTQKSLCRRECRPEEVPIVHLADWIKREVTDRRIPRIANKTMMPPPRVAMKMDIECAEYEVLPDLMLSGVMCNTIDAVMGEFHYLMRNITFERQGGEVPWTLKKEVAKQISGEWLRMIDHNPHCKTKFYMRDDESYRNDGQPLPPID